MSPQAEAPRGSGYFDRLVEIKYSLFFKYIQEAVDMTRGLWPDPFLLIFTSTLPSSGVASDVLRASLKSHFTHEPNNVCIASFAGLPQLPVFALSFVGALPKGTTLCLA